MENSFLKQAADFLKNKKNARRWMVLFLCLAVAVTTGTFAALKLNGQAMTNKRLECSFEVHKHTDDCYEVAANGEKTLVCGYADAVVHTHNSDCYDENGELVCQLPELEEHKHTEACFENRRVLTCGMEESAGHTHSDACYQVEQKLTCGVEESAGHTHSEACYDAEGNVICGMEESAGHTHGPECYTEERTLACGMEESAGHTHSDACYAEEKVATCGKLELHTHDEKCYATPEDAKDNDGDGKADGRPICGIPELVKHEHDESCFVDVQGTADEQKLSFFTTTTEDPEPGKAAADDSEAAPENKIEDETDTLQKIYEDSGVRVTAEYTAEANIPEEAQLQVKTVTEESDPEHFAQRKEEALEATGQEEADNMLLYNIGFFVNGEEIEPAAPVTITIQPLKDGFAVGTPVTVVHFGENGTETLDGTAVDEDGNTSFTSDSFSDYALMSLDGDGNSEGDEKPKGDMGDLLSGVTITHKDGSEIKDGQLFVGEKYSITLTFKEGGALSTNQFAWNDDSTMTYQLPDNFKVEPKTDIPLTIKVDGEPVEIGTYSVTEDGRLVVTLNEQGKKALDDVQDAEFSFGMEATVEAGTGSDDGHIKFDDAGKKFDFEVVDQARVEVDKDGKYTENAEKTGGSLEYTVTTTVKRGTVSGLAILDEFTPPNTTALTVGDVKPDDVKVTLKQLGADGNVTEVVLTKDTDYELVQVDDTEHPGKKTFQIKLKEGSTYYTLKQGDVLEVTYPYEVEYVQGSTDVFWGNVANDVHVTGRGKVPAPADDPSKETPEINIDEHRGSNVEIQVTPPGDGIIFKTQEFSEKDHKLHYTLYTVVPAGSWTPFFIQDDMVVEFGGQKYNLQEFKEGGRVSNLTVSAVDVERNKFGGWSDSTDEQREQSLEELKADAKELTGYDMYNVWNSAPEGYDPESVENCIRLWDNNNLDIVFGEWEYGNRGAYGNWNYEKDRLIITEYDLDMSDDLGELTLIDTSDYKTELRKSASEVLMAGITNTVHMRFSGYNPGYAVFFNNAERMNKTGAADKSDNSITWTVTMNTTDTTVNKYFQEVTADWMAQNAPDKHNWDVTAAYADSMQAVFYDELPDGWEYVEGSLTATARDKWSGESSYPYDTDGKLKNHKLVTQEGAKNVIRAPLMFFYNNENADRPNLFNQFGNDLLSLTFTYKLKATDEWIQAHATDKTAVTVYNYADIRDKLHPNQPHWKADANVDYLPQHLSKEAKQVGDSNLLQFTLHVNPGGYPFEDNSGKVLEYLTVIDKSENLEIQMSTIQVTDTAGNELKQVTYEEGMQLADDQWAIMSEPESGQFQLIVPNGKELLITYDAAIPELGTQVVSNMASIEGINHSDGGDKYTFNVNNYSASGSGSTYKLNFEKVDSTDAAKKLSGAKFKFYIVLDDAKEGSETDSGSTSESGSETGSGSTGESGSETGSEGDSGEGSETGSGGASEGGSVESSKNDKLKPNAEVTVGDKIYKCYSEDKWEFTTDANGVYQIDSKWRLVPGNYYILKETEAPEGYERLEEPVLFYFRDKEDADTATHPNALTAVPNGTLQVGDPPTQYELPETGGIGNKKPYTVGALFALAAVGILVYTTQKRRKEGN